MTKSKTLLGLLFLTLSLHSSVWAQAQPQVVQPILQKMDAKSQVLLFNLSTQFLTKLTARNIIRVGDLDLTKLILQMKSVIYGAATNVFLGGSGGNRMGAVNLPDQKLVLLNALNFPNVPAMTWPALLLHENFGALGYEDENYQKTLRLWLLAEYPDSSFALSEFRKLTIDKNIKYYLASGGSGTSVGGGGDYITLTLKIQLLQSLMKETNFSSFTKVSQFECIEEAVKMKMEPNQTYKFDGSVPPVIVVGKGKELSLQVSAEMWVSNKRDVLLKDVEKVFVQYMKEKYP